MCQVVPPPCIPNVDCGSESWGGPAIKVLQLRVILLSPRMDTDAEDEDSDSHVLAFQWRRSE